jgi:hypothetical protein
MEAGMGARDADADGRREGTPRWVKIFGIVAAVIAVLFAVSLLVGGGGHGPGRHIPGGDEPAGDDGGSTDHTPPVSGHG